MKRESDRKYTFIEFIAALESKDFDNVDSSWMEWALTFVEEIKNPVNSKHEGDCTRTPAPCYLCVFEGLLNDYRDYYFNEEKWRGENLENK
jgi:hypothetical protein